MSTSFQPLSQVIIDVWADFLTTAPTIHPGPSRVLTVYIDSAYCVPELIRCMQVGECDAPGRLVVCRRDKAETVSIIRENWETETYYLIKEEDILCSTGRVKAKENN